MSGYDRPLRNLTRPSSTDDPEMPYSLLESRMQNRGNHFVNEVPVGCPISNRIVYQRDRLVTTTCMYKFPFFPNITVFHFFANFCFFVVADFYICFLVVTPAGQEIQEEHNSRSVLCNGTTTDSEYDLEHDYRNDPLDPQCSAETANIYRQFLHACKYFQFGSKLFLCFFGFLDFSLRVTFQSIYILTF